jgi:hypothetical protein
MLVRYEQKVHEVFPSCGFTFIQHGFHNRLVRNLLGKHKNFYGFAPTIYASQAVKKCALGAT